MCIEHNECHYGGMYNVYVKRIFVITKIVHMNAGVSSESGERKRLKSLSHSHEAWHPRSTHIGCRVGGVTALLGGTYQVVLDNPDDDPTTYKEALEDVDVQEWKKAMDREMESMGSNSVWYLIEAPKRVKPIGCKWIYKRKRGPDGKVETFKARLVAKGYTEKEGIDYDETFLPVAMLKSIRILLAVAAALNYKIWQMDVKTAILNGELEDDIYMQQPKGFIALGQEHMVCKLHRSIYGLKQASKSWNIRFDQVIKLYGFEKSPDEPCVYKKIQGIVVVFLVHYVDDILLIGNSVKVLSDVKGYLK